jgi:diguanylate cyclase (GGDEF)-like protein
MLFLSLEHQILLVVVLIFSSYLFTNALLLRHQPASLRAFGFIFILPLILTIIAFFTATYQWESASRLMVLGHLFLILLCTLVLLLPDKSKAIKVFYLLPFVMLITALSLSSSPLYQTGYHILCCLAFGLVLIQCALIFHYVIQGNKPKMLLHIGLFMLSTGQGVWLWLQEPTLETVLIMAVGYVLCTSYVHKNALGALYKDYRANKETLDRMNASIHAEVLRRVEEIERSNRKLLEISKTDSMTGLYVKSEVIRTLESLLERTPRGNLSVLMFDIDKFKQINDNLGHQIGDRCIRTVANLAKTSFRNDDIVGRFGGDEFIVLLPGTSPAKAYLIAERFRQLVQCKSSPQFTVSIGIASYPEDAGSSGLLIEAADKALYMSKQKGRNQITLYSSRQTKE